MKISSQEAESLISLSANIADILSVLFVYASACSVYMQQRGWDLVFLSSYTS